MTLQNWDLDDEVSFNPTASEDGASKKTRRKSKRSIAAVPDDAENATEANAQQKSAKKRAKVQKTPSSTPAKKNVSPDAENATEANIEPKSAKKRARSDKTPASTPAKKAASPLAENETEANAEAKSVKKRAKRDKTPSSTPAKKNVSPDAENATEANIEPKSAKKRAKVQKTPSSTPAKRAASPQKPAASAKKRKSTASEATSSDVENEPEAEAAESQADETEEEKSKKKKMTIGKKKSVKAKAKKRKQKLDVLKSTMPKEELEKYLNPERSDESPQQLALNYLHLWKSTRAAWKFSKTRQTWLLRNIYSAEMMSDSDFDILLEYVENMEGLARSTTVEQASELLEQHKNMADADSKLKATRAKQMLQILI